MSIWVVVKTKKEAQLVKDALRLVYGKVTIRKRHDEFAVTFNPKVKSWFLKNQKNLKILFK